MGVEGNRKEIEEGEMKDWKTLAIILLAGVAVFQNWKLTALEKSYVEDMRLRSQEINKVSADALNTRLNNSKQFMLQMNCALVESSLKQWNACVTKEIRNASEPPPCPTDDPLGLKRSLPCTPLPPKR
jgi:hypothetical protein